MVHKCLWTFPSQKRCLENKKCELSGRDIDRIFFKWFSFKICSTLFVCTKVFGSHFFVRKYFYFGPKAKVAHAPKVSFLLLLVEIEQELLELGRKNRGVVNELGDTV